MEWYTRCLGATALPNWHRGGSYIGGCSLCAGWLKEHPLRRGYGERRVGDVRKCGWFSIPCEVRRERAGISSKKKKKVFLLSGTLQANTNIAAAHVRTHTCEHTRTHRHVPEDTHKPTNVTQHLPHIPGSPELALSTSAIHSFLILHQFPNSSSSTPHLMPKPLVSPLFFKTVHVRRDSSRIGTPFLHFDFDESFTPPEKSNYV